MALSTPPAAVIFDNDGLVLDSEEVWTRGEQVLYSRRGLEFTLDHKQELVGQNAAAAGAILERRLGEPGRAAEIIAELDVIVMEELENGVEPMPGAVEVLEAVGTLGLPRGLVSNSPRAFIEVALSKAGLGHHFDVTLSAHEVAAPKPAPDPYIEACAQLGVEPAEVIALEDSPTGVAAARAAGLTVIGIPSVPGVTLDEAHHVARTLRDPLVAELLGIVTSSR